MRKAQRTLVDSVINLCKRSSASCGEISEPAPDEDGILFPFLWPAKVKVSFFNRSSIEQLWVHSLKDRQFTIPIGMLCERPYTGEPTAVYRRVRFMTADS
jgi:hypothetical protein